MTRAAWAVQANGICEEMKTALEEATPASGEDLGKLAGTFEETASEHLVRIGALPRPPADATKIGDMLALYEDLVRASAELMEAFPAGAEADGDLAGDFARRERKIDATGRRAGAIARELGAVCLVE